MGGSIVGPLIEEDQILQAMPSVVLALHVLCERRQPDSFWRPYISILWLEMDINSSIILNSKFVNWFNFYLKYQYLKSLTSHFKDCIVKCFYGNAVGAILWMSLTFDLDVLPNEYTTPLYFSPQDLTRLKGSPALSRFTAFLIHTDTTPPVSSVFTEEVV